jgi:hypothetical protein
MQFFVQKNQHKYYRTQLPTPKGEQLISRYDKVPFFRQILALSDTFGASLLIITKLSEGV